MTVGDTAQITHTVVALILIDVIEHVWAVTVVPLEYETMNPVTNTIHHPRPVSLTPGRTPQHSPRNLVAHRNTAH
jgi:hypothetical protein